jgi:K+-sensing histidine kinase KdpD
LNNVGNTPPVVALNRYLRYTSAMQTVQQLAVLFFNYFFAPPIFDLRVRDPRDMALLIALSSR